MTTWNDPCGQTEEINPRDPRDHTEYLSTGEQMAKKYNGHPSYNAWNVSLWINNDEGLYSLARECVKFARSRKEAAERFLSTLIECSGPQNVNKRAFKLVATTPDGVPYTVTNIMRAMRDM